MLTEFLKSILAGAKLQVPEQGVVRRGSPRVGGGSLSVRPAQGVQDSTETIPPYPQGRMVVQPNRAIPIQGFNQYYRGGWQPQGNNYNPQASQLLQRELLQRLLR